MHSRIFLNSFAFFFTLATAVTLPAQQTPAQQTPARQTPAQQTPAQQTPAQQTPAQQTPAQVAMAELPDAPGVSSSLSTTTDAAQATTSQPDAQSQQQGTPGNKGDRILYAKPGTKQSSTPPADFGQQPKRILGLMPNFRAVSAVARPAPPTVKEKFKIATFNSFDYSAVVFAAIDAYPTYLENSYPTLGSGWSGYSQYYWRAFTDKAVGNYMTDFLFPIITREDSRYFTLGRGRKLYRAYYALSRLVITPSDSGNNTLNISEIAGKGVQAGLGNFYYPSSSITWSNTSQRWLEQLGRDGLTNIFREFWPDISTHVLHMKQAAQ